MYNTQEIFVNGINHNVYTFGNSSKEPLFFFHGFLDSGLSFLGLVEKLSEDYYCICPDFRGFGKSEHSPNKLGYFYYEYIADVKGITDHFQKDGKLKILGHSMGANIISLFAGVYPERVSHLINLEGLGIRETEIDHSPKKVKSWIDGVPRIQKNSIYKSKKVFFERFSQRHTRIPKNLLEAWAKGFLVENSDGTVTTSSDPLHKLPNPYPYRFDQIKAFWDSITAKCLLLMGGETLKGEGFSKRFLDEVIKRIELFPNGSNSIRIDGAGHMLHLERPNEVVRYIKKFLSFPRE